MRLTFGGPEVLVEQAEYVRLVRQAVDCLESGRIEDVQEAATIFESLLESDIPNLDKSMMCHNLAACADMLGQVTEALRWYDEGATYEQGCETHVNAEAKAVYLVQHGFVDKGLRAYEELLACPWRTEQERQRITDNLGVLGQAVSEAVPDES